ISPRVPWSRMYKYCPIPHRPNAFRNSAWRPIPSLGNPERSDIGEPAIVVTVPADKSTRRTEVPDVTYRLLPLPQIAVGILNRAERNGPSSSPATPGVPATVVTDLVARSIRRTVLFPLSVINRASPSDHTPLGELNLAPVPRASATPGPPRLPAT